MAAGPVLKLHPYVNGASYGQLAVVAANNGYARYANLSTVKNIWSDAPSAGDQGNALTPPPTAAMIAVNSQPVRVRTKTNPTAAEGVQLPVGTVFMLIDEPEILRDYRFIETTASAEVTIQYFYQE